MEAPWSADLKITPSHILHENLNTEVLIIGGGMCGLLCAYMLNKSGIDCILVEADRICGGVTGLTTAKITSQHKLIYHRISKRYGTEAASLYLQANESAVSEYKKLAEKIDCEFEIKPSFIYSTDNRIRLEKEMSVLENIGFPAVFTDTLPLPFPVAGAIRFDGQAQFNPLRFAMSVSKGLNIYERTKVLELSDKTAVTGSGTIRASKIIVATHFPFINKHGSYFIKQYQHRSYVAAYENAPLLNGMYADEANSGMSFRTFRNLLFIGGGSHRTGKLGEGWTPITEFAARHYPEAKEKYRWATQDCMSLDGIPYIGRYSKSTPDLLVATGFNKWGMTSSMVAAMLLRDLVLERENPYSDLFSPSRSIFHPQLAVNILESATGLINLSSRRCPHLGCALKWNKYEHSWDCPCHGSRFTADGELINNPATDDLPH